MTKRTILTFALAGVALIPPACVIESSSDKNDNGGESSQGGQTTAAGAANKGGATTTAAGGKATGGAVATGGTSTTLATNVAGNAGTPSNVGGANNAGAGGTAPVAGGGGATNIAGTAGTSTTIERTPVPVDADITAATTWTADKIYIISDTVYISAALTIQPGTIIKFKVNAGLNVQNTGQLNAIGTSTAPIVFTSIKDDSAGGDTNQDSAATQPAIGDWGKVYIGGNSSKLDYCSVAYATGGVEINAKSASVKHTIFTKNTLGLAASASDPSLIVTSNTFYGNTYPVTTDANIPVDATNIFHASGDATNTNKFQRILVEGDITQATVWNNVEVAHVLLDGTTYITNSSVLTLAAGVVLKFNANAALSVQTGSTLTGFATATFTSYRDDTKLGDSNGDGVASSPAAGDWRGVYDGTWLTGANILYNTPQ